MRGIRSFLVISLAAAFCLAASGCGDDESSADGSSGLSSPPAQFLGDMLADISKAKKRADCKDVAAANRRATYVIVCPPVTPEQRKSIRSIKLLGAERFGNAALIDYRSSASRKGAQAIVYRDEDGLWTLARMGLLSPDGSIGTTDDEDGEEAEAAVERYLTAVRERDCAAFNKYAATNSSDLEKVCQEEFPATRELARKLANASDPKIAYVGGTQAYRFYDVGIAADRHTVMVVRTAEGSLRPFVVLATEQAPPRS